MLEKLRKYSSVEEIKECVRNFYHTFDNDSYIPGIFKKKTFYLEIQIIMENFMLN